MNQRSFRFFIGTVLATSITPAVASECRGIENDADRLACYDERYDGAESCKVEHLKFVPNGTVSVNLKGTTSCENGELRYSVFDKDGEFLDSGFHYFEGFTFKAYTDIPMPMPEGMTLKYTIMPWQ